MKLNIVFISSILLFQPLLLALDPTNVVNDAAKASGAVASVAKPASFITSLLGAADAIPEVGEIAAAIQTAFEVIKEGIDIVEILRADTREAAFLRMNKPVVTVIQTANTANLPASLPAAMRASFSAIMNSFGIGHMKPIKSFSKDYFLKANNEHDINIIKRIVASKSQGEIYILEKLANNNLFKDTKARKAFTFRVSPDTTDTTFQQNFGQFHLVVIGKGTELHYSGLPDTGNFTVDFSDLDTMLKEIAQAPNDSENIRTILKAYSNNVTNFWYTQMSTDGKVAVSVPWAKLLPKYLKDQS